MLNLLSSECLIENLLHAGKLSSLRSTGHVLVYLLWTASVKLNDLTQMTVKRIASAYAAVSLIGRFCV